MSKKASLTDADQESRQRTANTLRRLREVTRQIRTLKADIDSASDRNAQSHLRTPRR